MSTAEKLTTIIENEQKVYDAGRLKAEYDIYSSFCDINAPNDDGTFYVAEKPFYRWRNCEYIRPPFKIKPCGYSYLSEMFAYCEKLKKVEKEYFDLTKCSKYMGSRYSGQTSAGSSYQMFNYCRELEEIEDIHIPPHYYNRTFYECNKLKKIEAMYFDEKTKMYNAYTFSGCKELTDLTAYGVIANDMYFQNAKALNVESLKSIILILKDFSGLTDTDGNSLEFTHTIIFASQSFTTLDEEGATSPNGNTWAEYIDDLKWNLTLV